MSHEIVFQNIFVRKPLQTSNLTVAKALRILELSDSINVEKIGRKHLLQVRNLDEIRDAGTYTCHAVNPVGEFKENFHIQGIYIFICFYSNVKYDFFQFFHDSFPF